MLQNVESHWLQFAAETKGKGVLLEVLTGRLQRFMYRPSSKLNNKKKNRLIVHLGLFLIKACSSCTMFGLHVRDAEYWMDTV